MLTLAGVRKYNRYQAALGHFGLSLLIFIILGYLVYFCWYPQPLFSIDAGWQGIRILAFVDFVLGPCITLVIFNPKKKELFKDLAIIALIQISALSYGVYHVYQSRPAIVVYADNQFRTVSYSELNQLNLPENIASSVSNLKPAMFFLDIPRENIIFDFDSAGLTKENMNELLENYDKQVQPAVESLALKIPYFLLPHRLQPYSTNVKKLNKYSVNNNDLKSLPKETKDKALSFIQTHNSSFAITSVRGRYGYALVAIDSSGDFIDFIEGNYIMTWLSN